MMASGRNAAMDVLLDRDVTPSPCQKPAEVTLVTPTSSRPHTHATRATYLDTPTPLRTSALASTDLTTPKSLYTTPRHDHAPRDSSSTTPPISTPDSETGWTDISQDDLTTMPPALLRDKLLSAQAVISSLTKALHETRQSAAHSLLQHRLLTLHTLEATERHRVETSLAEREIEVLRRPHPCSHPRTDDSGDATKVLEAEVQKRRLRRLRRQLSETTSELERTKRENESLKRTIREGRTRTIANTLQASRRQQRELQIAPVQHQQPIQVPRTPKQQTRPQPGPIIVEDTRERDAREEHEHKLQTLGYLASQVLSQASLSPTPTPAPVTPTPRRTQRQHKSVLMSPVSLFPLSQGSVQNEAVESPRSKRGGEKRKRRSRDSTISVEDAEEMRRVLESERAATGMGVGRVVGWSPINA
ncbi:hypothetical protein BJ508DRAFT_418093 [Ascobolus immersus RN42]|uniref:Uncharacterized protein n=1 Tax=Ascobolus immersus RN42 TaxID=1160509 RepID=A0A3N4HSP2_ASCIM|nr:hypothetical protein BJ508DRAFT_418093 [Ascobolus immersus RN42]